MDEVSRQAQRQRAVRLVEEHREEYPLSSRDHDGGVRELKRLNREVAELERVNEILRSATFFAAELDRPSRR